MRLEAVIFSLDRCSLEHNTKFSNVISCTLVIFLANKLYDHPPHLMGNWIHLRKVHKLTRKWHHHNQLGFFGLNQRVSMWVEHIFGLLVQFWVHWYQVSTIWLLFFVKRDLNEFSCNLRNVAMWWFLKFLKFSSSFEVLNTIVRLTTTC